MVTRRDGVAWALLVGVPVAWEFHQLRRREIGVPLSTVIRAGFRTDTPQGAAAFVLAVDLGAAWLKGHILS